MPTTRRSSRPAGRQSTLSFNHRVTKSSVPKSAKSDAKNLVSTSPTKQSPLGKHVSTADLESEPELEGKEEVKAVVPEPEPEKSEAELRAQKVADSQIEQYWRALERERKAPRVHQEDLSLAEKVLRYWDVSSQYGPCVGISRIKRWQRAQRLGLNPPLEVLAVLLKGEKKGTKGIERAHIDEILNATVARSFRRRLGT
ncbi:hypothetical protein DL763_002395 [Monosporascus cannonballus]|nr:hypothetical protein DL763_002395 [Monosporascus cannonballus]